MWSRKIAGCPASKRAAANSVSGDFSARRWPTMTRRKRFGDLARVCRAAGRLKNNATFATHASRQGFRRAFLQDNQRLRQRQRTLGGEVGLDVAIQIGAGQHHGQPACRGRPRMRGAPGGNGVGGAARVQGDHHAILARFGIRPLLDDTRREER
jgi:hypothetical protein